MLIPNQKRAIKVCLTGACFTGFCVLMTIATLRNEGGIEIAAGPVYITVGGDAGGLKTGLRDSYDFHLIVNLSKRRRIRIK